MLLAVAAISANHYLTSAAKGNPIAKAISVILLFDYLGESQLDVRPYKAIVARHYQNSSSSNVGKLGQ